MDEKEHVWDRLLNIRTSGRDDSHADNFRFPYEPTPYIVLEKLSDTGLITKKNTLIDYGSGKGRVGFYMSYQTKCISVGVEFDEQILKKALENKDKAVSGKRTDFVLIPAEKYKVPEKADRFYFFNPFSEVLLRSVIGRIRESVLEAPREVLMFFYYPSDEYRKTLFSETDIFYVSEIDLHEFFPGNNSRERILICRMGEEK